MVTDNIAERNAHIAHCRAMVAGWSMRDVLDFIAARYVIVAEYPPDADTEDMARVDAANREAAALYMAGY